MRISDWSSDVCSSDLQGGPRSISRRAMRQSLQLARASRFIGLSINPAELLRAPNSNGSFNPIELRARRTADILSGTINRLAHHRNDAAIIRQVLNASISEARKRTRLKSRHQCASRLPSSAFKK